MTSVLGASEVGEELVETEEELEVVEEELEAEGTDDELVDTELLVDGAGA